MKKPVCFTQEVRFESFMMIKNKREQILTNEDEEKKAIRAFFQNATEGFFVEVGANEPTEPESQTWHLEQLGWKGILVEPIPDLAKKAKHSRPNSKIWQMACTSNEEQGIAEFLIPFDNEKLITGHASLRANIDEHNYKNFKKIQIQTTTLTKILKSENANHIDFLSIDA